jgi:hypothetical protein
MIGRSLRPQISEVGVRFCNFIVTERLIESNWTQKIFYRAFKELSNDVYGIENRSKNRQLF